MRQYVHALYLDALLNCYSALLPSGFYQQKAMAKRSNEFLLYVYLLKAYARTVRNLKASDYAVIEQVQMRRLRKLLVRAKTAPWWHARFRDQVRLSRPIGSLADLQVLSPITRFDVIDVPKADLRTHPTDDSRIVWRKSGGSTTGTPFTWGVSKAALMLHGLAHFITEFEKYGFSLNKAALHNFYITFNYAHPATDTVDFKWFAHGDIKTQVAGGKYEPEFEEKLRTLCTLVDSLNGMAVIRVSPPVLRFMTQELQARNLKPRIGFINVVGNVLEPGVRDMAAAYFNCPVIPNYGAQEFGAVGIACPEDPETYHLFPDRVLMEILDESGTVTPLGTEGNITITTLDNPDMPMIRYQPGDVGLLEGAHCACGYTAPLLRIARRKSEIFTYQDGREVSAGYLLRYFNRTPFVALVRRFQLRNEARGEVRVLLEMIAPLPTEARAQLAGNIRAVYGDGLSFTIEEVDAIPEEGPKFKMFVGLKK